MKTGLRIIAAALAVIVVAAPAVWASSHDKAGKQQPSASPPGSKAPERIEGEVVAIDQNSGMMTVRLSDGSVQQFQGNKETLKDYKVGDRIEGRLRQQPSR